MRRFLASFAVRLAAVAIASNATKRLRSGRFVDGDLNTATTMKAWSPWPSEAPPLPAAWAIDEANDAFFIVKDHNGHALAYVSISRMSRAVALQRIC